MSDAPVTAVPPPAKLAVRVYHSGYGCDTGCCGHRIELGPDDGAFRAFAFAHPDDGEDPIAFAKRIVNEKFGDRHAADLDWEHAEIEALND